MHFALLLSKLPHLEEPRSHYATFLSLQPRPALTRPGATGSISALWQRVKAFAS